MIPKGGFSSGIFWFHPWHSVELSKHGSIYSMGIGPTELSNWGWWNARFLPCTAQLFYSKTIQFWVTASLPSTEVQRKVHKSLCGRMNNGPKRYPGPHPWNLRMLPYTAEEFLQKWLRIWKLEASWITYLCHQCSRKCLYKRRQKGGRFYYREGDMTASAERFEDAKMLALKVKEGATSQGMQLQKLERASKRILHSIKLLEGAQPCQYFDFIPVKLL